MVYNDLAEIYDELMADTNYDQWVDYLIKQIKNYKAPGEVLLDLGCGTGSIAIPLAKQGYRVTGIDISSEMLTQAEQKAREAEVNISFYQQDIKELTLDFQVDVVIATFDTLNYIIDEKALAIVFKRISKVLRDSGLLIFDLNTRYKLENILGENTYSYNTDELVYIWENYFDQKTKICQMDLTFFALEPNSGKFLRFDETHFERAYEVEEIEDMLTGSGFKILGIFGELGFDSPKENEERIFFVVKKIVEK